MTRYFEPHPFGLVGKGGSTKLVWFKGVVGPHQLQVTLYLLVWIGLDWISSPGSYRVNWKHRPPTNPNVSFLFGGS